MKINWKAAKWTVLVYGGSMTALISFGCLPDYILRPVMLTLIIVMMVFMVGGFIPFVIYTIFVEHFKEKTSIKEKPKHVPMEIRLHTEFGGDLVACGKWYVAHYKETQWDDLIMMQILLIERMNTLIASSTNN